MSKHYKETDFFKLFVDSKIGDDVAYFATEVHGQCFQL